MVQVNFGVQAAVVPTSDHKEYTWYSFRGGEATWSVEASGVYGGEVEFKVELIKPEALNSFAKCLESRPDFSVENRARLIYLIEQWVNSISDPSVAKALQDFQRRLSAKGVYFSSHLTPAAPIVNGNFIQPAVPQAYTLTNIAQPSYLQGPVPVTMTYINAVPYPPPVGSFYPGSFAPNTPTWPERKAKIEADIELANNSIGMFVESVQCLEPTEDVARNDIVQEFRQKCTEIRDRVISLIEEIQDAEVV
ncbi:hypothetical protein BDK51DRAFT_25544, partial [Blyttiomyces helicus]